MVEMIEIKNEWVNVLVNESIKKYMILTDDECGDGETYVLRDLYSDGWEMFCDIQHTHKQAVKFMESFYPEYSLLKYETKPINFKTAKEFINKFHRHHVAPQGHKFSLAVTDGLNIIGIAIAGRPVSRYKDNGETIEVTRLCVKNGYKNMCSLLYSKIARIAKEMGYEKVITYTLESEDGKSLKASGYNCIGINKGGSWSVKSRPRSDKHPTGNKRIWEYKLVS